MTREGAATLAYIIMLGLLAFAVFLVFAGAVEVERRAEKWERYEKWFHPPDDDDGITLMEDDHENSR